MKSEEFVSKLKEIIKSIPKEEKLNKILFLLAINVAKVNREVLLEMLQNND